MNLQISSIQLEYLEEGSENGRDMWRTLAPLTFQDGLTKFTIDAGFLTDLASVPRLLWWMFPPYGRHLRAAVVHDWLYVQGVVTRAQADALFLAAMAAYKVPRWRRWAMYIAVRCFGWLPYRAHRKRAVAAS